MKKMVGVWGQSGKTGKKKKNSSKKLKVSFITCFKKAKQNCRRVCIRSYESFAYDLLWVSAIL